MNDEMFRHAMKSALLAHFKMQNDLDIKVREEFQEMFNGTN